MLKRSFTKTLAAMLTIYAIMTVNFLMVRFMPGDPLLHILGADTYYNLLRESPEQLERISNLYGLNDTLYTQYISYLKSVVTGDFGTAYSNGRPVLDNVLNAAKWTLILGVPTFVFGGILGGTLGVYAGWHLGGRFDKIMTPVMIAINTIPLYCIAILFLVTFAFRAGWFPINGMTTITTPGLARAVDILWHACLPLILLILSRTAGNFLLMKSNISQVRNEDYIITALSKGLSDTEVLFRHVIKNAMLPFVTSLCLQLGNLLSGSMMVEVIFGWKGMGHLFYTSVSTRDFPTAQLCFMISAVCIVLGILLSDVVVSVLDRRVGDSIRE